MCTCEPGVSRGMCFRGRVGLVRRNGVWCRGGARGGSDGAPAAGRCGRWGEAAVWALDLRSKPSSRTPPTQLVPEAPVGGRCGSLASAAGSPARPGPRASAEPTCLQSRPSGRGGFCPAFRPAESLVCSLKGVCRPVEFWGGDGTRASPCVCTPCVRTGCPVGTETFLKHSEKKLQMSL